MPIARPIPTDQTPQSLCLDRGYDYDVVRKLAAKLRDPTWRARRWVVEACHSWMNRNRALLICWSKKPENHTALMHLAAGLIAFKKAHTTDQQG